MPAKCPPSLTVALCGLKEDVAKSEVEKLVDTHAKGLVSSSSQPLRDKGDPEGKRRLVFLNCSSADGAAKVIQALNEKVDKTLGVETFQHRLQAVKKSAISSVDWSKYTTAKTKTFEGTIAKKRKIDCFIDQPMNVWVPKSAFEGDDADWDALKVGDVLRVEAQDDGDASGALKAIEAVLVAAKKPATSPGKKTEAAPQRDAAQAMEEAQRKVFADAERKVGDILVANLQGKGWVSLATIGQWFNEGQDAKDALSVIKTKYKQLKNFAAASSLVAVKQERGDFKIHLQEDLEAASASLTDAEKDAADLCSQKARVAAMKADIATGDESPEEREGRVRSFRAMCIIMELAPRILVAVYRKAWQIDTKKTWSKDSGPELLNRIKNSQEFAKKLGHKILEKMKKADVESWDISLLARLLLDDPGILKVAKDASKAAKDIRSYRNSFAHEFPPTLTQDAFHEFWDGVMVSLRTLSDFCGQDIQNELERETSKILSAGIDQEKEIKFSAEAQRVRNELEGLKGAMSDMSNEMKSIQKKMVTESVMERKVKEQVAAAVATLPQAAKRSVKLSSGTTYFWHDDDRLAGGAQGSVFKAMSKEGGQIALKLAEHTTSRNDREHENLMKLKHPNVVKYIGHGMTENNGTKELAIGMELVAGLSYDKYLEQHGPLKWELAAKDFSQLIEGMACVHAQGIVHRDLKPANLMRRKRGGRIVIVDFGLSKSSTNDTAAAASVTMLNTFKGTIAYSAPEQHKKNLGDVSAASDVFAMAIILYEALTGELPFPLSSDTAVSQRATVGSITELEIFDFTNSLVTKDPIELTTTEAPGSINKFLLTCLKKKPGDRFKDAGTMKMPWEAAVDEADNIGQAAKEASPAHQFWTSMWGDKEEVTPADFKQVFMNKPFSLSAQAAAQLVSECDVDDNGSISLEEFQTRCGDKDPTEIAKEAKANEAASKDPEGVYFKSDLVMPDVRYTSKGDFLGGKKNRVGYVTLKSGKVSVRRNDNGSLDYEFDLRKTDLKTIDDTTIQLIWDKARNFSFKSQGETSQFMQAYEKTKKWIESES